MPLSLFVDSHEGKFNYLVTPLPTKTSLDVKNCYWASGFMGIT